ncbi:MULTISPECIES: hypothetical protein [unclassified Streptomyces]|uniref:hypothetical protein n=1 Tax=unclassified Streptomyces TaxID=2593676 RepID=UPI000939843B|nr:hypothetical protein [Streptomyces sp. CB02366]OKJ38183.1 hypothetical protein AMK24_10940 [Streptomyces sp. CB02366]
MNAKRVSAAAGVILAAQKQRQTPAGIAAALEAAGLLQSPESAAELVALRKDSDALREQRNSVFKTNEELLIRVERADLERLRVENENRALVRGNAPDEEPEASRGRCGYDDYHDGHEWADRPRVWCPGHSYADDTEGGAL